jgi:hypothetical protein
MQQRGDGEPPVPVPTSEMALLAWATFLPVTGSNWSVRVEVALTWVFHIAFIVDEQKFVIKLVHAVWTDESVFAELECMVAIQISPADPGPDTVCRKTVMREE